MERINKKRLSLIFLIQSMLSLVLPGYLLSYL